VINEDTITSLCSATCVRWQRGTARIRSLHAAAAAIDRDHLPARPTAANQQQRVCCCRPMPGQTDRRTLYRFIHPVPHNMLAVPITTTIMQAVKVQLRQIRSDIAANWGHEISRGPRDNRKFTVTSTSQLDNISWNCKVGLAPILYISKALTRHLSADSFTCSGFSATTLRKTMNRTARRLTSTVLVAPTSILLQPSDVRRRVTKHKLDAEQSPALARPAAPLAASMQRRPCTKTNKIWLPSQRALMDRKSWFQIDYLQP